MNYAAELKERIFSKATPNPVRAVIYARVSTDNDGQKDSCTNQIELAKRFIDNHANITLVGIYVDDGLSGKNDYNRPDYNAMIEQIESEKAELIITKALSRLNRDQLNSLQLTNILIEHNATVLTLEDGQIHDFEDIGTELLHSLSFAIDAQYVKRQSINGRKTQELRCERKELSAKDISFGYIWNRNTKTISIDRNKTEIITYIFEEYVYRSGTPSGIKRDLESKGTILSERTISNILQDERYIGKFYINKRTTKLGTGKTKSKRINLPREVWVLVERPDLQIIDEELFNMAQKVRQNRQTIYIKPEKEKVQAYFRGTHKFSSIIFCANCGKPFHFAYADRKKTLGIYNIRNHSGCNDQAKRITEQDLQEITRMTLKATIDRQEEVCATLEQILTDVIKTQNNTGSIEKLRKQKNSREKQIDSLIDTLSEGGLSDVAKQRIKTKINTIEDDIAELTNKIKEMETSKLDDNFVQKKILTIKNSIEELRNFTSIDRDRILNYIERINIHSNGDIDMLLKSGNKIIITRELPKKVKNNDTNPREDNVVKTRIQDGL